MTVTETHEGRGQFDIRLSESCPPEIRDVLDEFGHVAVTGTRLDPRRQGDGLLDDCWAGVVLGVSDDDAPSVTGQGVAWHLGDHEGKGRVFTSEPLTASSYTFADAIRGLLPASVAEGTLHSVAGSYTPGTHLWQTPRQAIDRACSLFEAEWRVYPHSTDGVRLDAGEPSQLWPDVTTVVAKGVNGREPSGLEGVPAVRMLRYTDGRDYTTKVVALPEGEGDSLVSDAATAELAAGDIPYRDLRGNTLEITRVVSLSDVSRGNAQAAADVQLNRFNSAKDAHELDVDRYHISGIVEPGVSVAIYDPVKGLVDPGNPQRFAGRTIWPVTTRVRSVTWPVEAGMGVYYRAADGTWTDLTDHVQFESGSTKVDIGRARSLTQGGEPVGVRLQTEDDGRTPATPAFQTPFVTGVYLDAEGKTRAHVTVQWAVPILNDDGSTVTDGSHVQVQFRESGAGSWDTRSVGWGEADVRLTGLDPGVSYDFRARAVDVHGNRSAFTAIYTQTAEADTIPPSTPAAATVAGNVLYIQVSHDLGQASGGTFNLESDLDHLEVHVGTVSTFTPDATTLEGTLTANAGMLAQSVSAVGTFEVPDTTQRWVKVIAVDHAGNKSSASSAASVTAALIDTQHITDAIITTAKIDDAAVTTLKVADAAITNAKIDTLDAGKITAGTITGQTITVGSNGQLVFNHNTALNLGGRWYLRKHADNLDFEVHDAVTNVTRLRILDGGAGQLFDSNAVLVASWGQSGVRVAAGTAASPSIGWESDPTSGMFQPSASTVSTTANGTEVLRVQPGRITGFYPFRAASGSAASPSYSFTALTDTGFWLDTGSNNLVAARLGANEVFVGGGGFFPAADNAKTLGSSGLRWKEVWAVDGTINTSDPDAKTDVKDMPDLLGLPFLRAIRPVVGRWNDGTRIHSWLLADDIRDRLAERDVDLAVYVDPSHDGEQGPLGLRYHEVIPMLVRAVQQLADRVDALQGA